MARKDFASFFAFPVENLPPCTPLDILNQPKQTPDVILDSGQKLINIADCPYDCRHEYYDTRITEGSFDFEAVNRLYGDDENYVGYTPE